jgi:predicted dehydrogenase
MRPTESKNGKSQWSRRAFLRSTAAAGAAALVAPRILHAQNAGSQIRLGVIGTGTEGRVLIMSCLKARKAIPFRFTAICDIWPYYRNYTARLLNKYKQPVTQYGDYQEMLAGEKGKLDAVIIATPDWVHAEQAIGCLEAGVHVYCEKEMSNTAESAKKMVEAAKKTGKLLQIGHQRRSNPRYHMMLDYIHNKKACGRITNVSGQWNRQKPYTAKWSEKSKLDEATLKKYGYDTMERFRNWRWYKKFSGGPIADLGSHQVDIFHWVLNAPPKSVLASGGSENYPKMEWYDSVIAIYEWDYTWEGETRVVRGQYDLFSTTSHGGYVETFMGTEGSLVISESLGKGGIRREYTAPEADWEKELQKKLNLAEKAEAAQKKESGEGKTVGEGDITVAHSIPSPGRYYPPLPAPAEPKTEHQPHLENFFQAVLGKEKLNCPGEVGYETAVSILRVNEAVAAAKRLEFKPEDFKV